MGEDRLYLCEAAWVWPVRSCLLGSREGIIKTISHQNNFQE